MVVNEQTYKIDPTQKPKAAVLEMRLRPMEMTLFLMVSLRAYPDYCSRTLQGAESAG
jgi:hypothetical protein